MASGRQFLSASQRDELVTLEVKKANTPKLMTAQDKKRLEGYYKVIAYLVSVNGSQIKAYRKQKSASCGV